MNKAGILVGFLLIITMTIGINIINSNRLVSDVNAYQLRDSYLEDTRELNKVLNDRRINMYQENYYQSKDGLTVIENKLSKVDTELKMNSFNILGTNEPLFIATDLGSYFSGKIPYCAWPYKDDLVEWDGKLIKSIKTTNKLMMYQFSVERNNTSGLEGIYNLDYYTDIPDAVVDYDVQLDNRVGILVEVKDSAVVGYTILNSNIKDYNRLFAYNLRGNEIMVVYKDVLKKQLPIPGTEITEDTEGDLIKLNFSEMSHIEGQLIGHRQTVVHAGPVVKEISFDTSLFSMDVGSGVDSVELEIYGTNEFLIQLNYRMLIKQ